MYSAFRLALKYVRYYITASSGSGHGIHSPFVFDFITRVLNDKRNFYAYQRMEDLRQRLQEDHRLLEAEDFGAGSFAGNKKTKKVSALVQAAAKSPKMGRLLFRLTNYYQPSVMIELGTSLGMSAAFLSAGNPAARLITLEGAPAVAAIAKENFAVLGIPHIEVVTGNFDDTLEPVLAGIGSIDLAFIDGNHRREPTLRYFKQLLAKVKGNAVFIVDDIHWSPGMEAAWNDIKNHPQVMLTIDLFFLGLVFFNPGFKVKQHFVIRF